MELRHLRYFLAVARHHNFTRAAEELHMAQPPLSQQMQQLERELGVTLFDRSARQVELTQAGEVLLARAQRLLEMVDDLTTEVREVAGAQRGRVTLGVNRTAAAGIGHLRFAALAITSPILTGFPPRFLLKSAASMNANISIVSFGSTGATPVSKNFMISFNSGA